jgi:hypothetical protein
MRIEPSRINHSVCARGSGCVVFFVAFAVSAFAQLSVPLKTGRTTETVVAEASAGQPVCRLPVAVGAPGSRYLPADRLPTHINIMGTRYWDLVYTLNGYQKTAIPLVAINGSVLGPGGTIDDVGSYYLLPKLANMFGWPMGRTIDLFYSSLLLVGFLTSVAGFFRLHRSLLPRTVTVLGLTMLTAVSYKIGDVYVFCFVTAAIAVPWTLVLIRQKSERGIQLGVFVFSLGVLAGLANAARNHAGTSPLIFIGLLLLFGISASRARKLILFLCLLSGVLLPKVFFSRLAAERDAFLISQCPEYAGLPRQHPLWHAVYMGLGYLQNDYGLRWDDGVTYRMVQSVAPGTTYGSDQDERILKGAVFSFIRQHPKFVLMTLASKFGVILAFVVISANFGLLAAAASPKPWPVELAFWAALVFSSLPGFIAIPEPAYLLGLTSFSALYGIVSFSPVCESVFARSTQWHSSRRRLLVAAGETIETVTKTAFPSAAKSEERAH